ncbi:MAG: hypothetical protein KDJ73_14355 [Notoacmeibacter sp.]|nr:hypothetical protein [Notoacmeibacter sp.]MCC0033555.1 hypothetical protein [Brucellaceae bacterium]
MTGPEPHTLWMAKLAGATLGSAISLTYILPRGRREAALRFATGLVCGVLFGALTGAKIARDLDLEQVLAPHEVMMAGAALASLSAWWALGFLMRLLARPEPTRPNATKE